MTPAQYNSGSIPQSTANQLSQETSGNAALKPEQADTYTIGVNFAPSQIPHLTGSIDYYHILPSAASGLFQDPRPSMIGCLHPSEASLKGAK